MNSVLRSAKRAPANVRRLNNISDVIFYCSVGERSRALALLHAAQDRFVLEFKTMLMSFFNWLTGKIIGRINSLFKHLEEYYGNIRGSLKKKITPLSVYITNIIARIPMELISF